MRDRNFQELLERRWAAGRFLCVGLDSSYYQIPDKVIAAASNLLEAVRHFNVRIVIATKEFACAYKLNSAFYEAQGEAGWRALRQAIQDIHQFAPNVPVILDAKRADIGDTNLAYAEAAFSFFEADAVTVSHYFGEEALRPFLDKANKGIFVLCRTSNPGAAEFQDLLVQVPGEDRQLPTYQYVAHRVANVWKTRGSCGLVVGATRPTELAAVRAIVGEMPILIPGIGAQGGALAQAVKAGMNADGTGMIINASRSIIFASEKKDFDEAAARRARELSGLINQYIDQYRGAAV